MFVSKFDIRKEYLKLSPQEKNVVLNRKSVEKKPCINRDSRNFNLKILLYLCYDEHEPPSSCNTTVYLSQSNPGK